MTEKNTPSTSPTKEPEPEKSATKDPEPEKSVRKRNDNAECAAFNNLFRQCNSDSKKRPAGKSQVTNQRKKVRTENTSETNDEEAERVDDVRSVKSSQDHSEEKRSKASETMPITLVKKYAAGKRKVKTDQFNLADGNGDPFELWAEQVDDYTVR